MTLTRRDVFGTMSRFCSKLPYLGCGIVLDMPLFERTLRLNENEGMYRGTNVVNVLVGGVGFRKGCW